MNLKYTLDHDIFKFDTPYPLVLGTAGKAVNKIKNSQDRNSTKTEEIFQLSNFLKITENKIYMLDQVHGDLIINIDSMDNKPFPVADGIITKTVKCCLVIRTADCVPVFVFDKKNSILGAVHSGWKGCKLNISGKLIKKIKAEHGSTTDDLCCYILPSIGPESYVIKMDVGSYFTDDIITRNNNIYLDLWKNIYNSFKQEGISDENILVSGLCTYKNNTDFFSYRRGDSGRNLNFAYFNKGI
jgi:polyphenol oxidase